MNLDAEVLDLDTLKKHEDRCQTDVRESWGVSGPRDCRSVIGICESSRRLHDPQQGSRQYCLAPGFSAKKDNLQH
jgi:hypothetical protein